MVKIRLSHVGICVAELERSLRLYRDALGFREVRRLDVAGAPAETLLALPGAALEAVYLERDGTTIELLHYTSPGHADAATGEPRPMNAPGLTHLSFAVDDLDAAAHAIAGAGGRMLTETRIDNPKLRARAVFALDPDGTRIELVESR